MTVSILYESSEFTNCVVILRNKSVNLRDRLLYTDFNNDDVLNPRSIELLFKSECFYYTTDWWISMVLPL